ncbi:hypothetical protein EJB05_08769, partial [Eragrostis curvula]
MPETREHLTEYERRRLENIERNEAILGTLRRDAADLSAAFAASRPKKRGRPKGKKQPRAAPTVPAGPPRRSGRARLQPPYSSEDASLPSAHLLKPRAADFRVADVFVGQTVTDVSAPLTSAILAASWPPPLPEIEVARVLPLADRTVVAAGTRLGHLVFWDADRPAPARVRWGSVGNNGVFKYQCDAMFTVLLRSVAFLAAFVDRIEIHIYSCTHDGDMCLMDVEKEIFSTIHLCDDHAFSLCQAPDHASCLYFGEGSGVLKTFDERAGKVSSKWQLHGSRITSIDFNPENTCMLATSSADSTACLWDLRNMKSLKPGKLKVVKHKAYVQAAYFSPRGSFLATTSRDNTVGILNIHNFNISCFQQHVCHSTTFNLQYTHLINYFYIDVNYKFESNVYGKPSDNIYVIHFRQAGDGMTLTFSLEPKRTSKSCQLISTMIRSPLPANHALKASTLLRPHASLIYTHIELAISPALDGERCSFGHRNKMVSRSIALSE